MISILEPLMKQLYFQVENTKELMHQANILMMEQEIYPGGRTCLELLTHIALLMEADVLIIQGATDEDMEKYYTYWQKELTTIEVIEARLDLSFNILQDFYNTLEEDEMLDQKMTYWQLQHSYIEWLTVILTHITHHKSQLYSFLKQEQADLKGISLFE